MKRQILTLVAGCSFAFGACSSSSDSQPAPEESTAEALVHAMLPGGTPVMVSGFEFHAPADWVPVPNSSSMRKASFEFGPVGSDGEKADLGVFYFGPDQGGSVEANIERWLGQVKMADGDRAERETISVAGYPIHFVRANGTYSFSMGGPMSGQSEQKPGWRLVGAILEGSQGNIFFRIAGPEATVRAMEPGLRTMLEGLSQGRE